MLRAFFHSICCLVLLLGSRGILEAEAPGVSYIYPAGAQRGTEVEVRIGGFYLFDKASLEFLSDALTPSANTKRLPTTLWFEGPRIAMPASQAKEDYPVDNSASIKVSNDAATGIHYWRVWTSQGIVPAQSFVVGELPEIVEEEIDGSPVPVDVEVPLTINGRIFQMEEVAEDEVVQLGSLEVWEFSNEGRGAGMSRISMPHPIHLHGKQFQVLDRSGVLHNGYLDDGWKDTVLLMPGERIRILVKFEDYSGLFLYHCHNLEHEDMGMMRNYLVKS